MTFDLLGVESIRDLSLIFTRFLLFIFHKLVLPLLLSIVDYKLAELLINFLP